jgi:hypothetical protein
MNAPVFYLMAITLAGFFQTPTLRDRPATGSICLAPVADDGDPRGHFSDAFAVKIDDRDWVAVPRQPPKLIADIALEGRHVVRIRDGKRQTESFRFDFGDFASRDLCLWYKPWYSTWSLTDARQGYGCRCSRTKEGAALRVQSPDPPKPGVCESEGEKLVGSKPTRIGVDVRPSKKRQDVPPNLPALPNGTTGSGFWLGEVLVGKDGRVVKVWTLREPQLDPPLAAFTAAIVAAMEAVEYEPTMVGSKPQAVCITSTFIIEWR